MGIPNAAPQTEQPRQTEVYIACPQQLVSLGDNEEMPARIANMLKFRQVDKVVDLFARFITTESAADGSSLTLRFPKPRPKLVAEADLLLRVARGEVQDNVRRILIINPPDADQEDGLEAVARGQVVGFQRAGFKALARKVLEVWNSDGRGGIGAPVEGIIKWSGGWPPTLDLYRKMADKGEIASFVEGISSHLPSHTDLEGLVPRRAKK